MGAFVDFSGLTLNPEEARASADLIFEAFKNKPELAQAHQVMTGVRMDKFIPILGHRPLVGKIDAGSCSNNDITDGIPVSQKRWTPEMISARLINCQDDLPALIKFWRNKQKSIDYRSEIDNEYQAYVMDDTLNALTESALRLASFGDPNEDTFANNGNLTNGTDKAYFTPIKGIWAQVITDQALPTPLTYRYTITENSGISKAAQLALAADTGLNVLRNLYNNIDSRAFKMQNLAYQMTRSLFNNWQDFMEDKSLVFMLDRTEQGSTKWMYRGIPIIVREDWDDTIRTYYDNGTTYYLPHRAWLTSINNIPIGTLDSSSLAELKSHFDLTTEKHYIKFAYNIDAKILLEYAFASAY